MPDSREESLVEEFLPLARRLARDFYFPGGDEDDVMQEAMIGLLRGIRGFDPDRGVPLRNFLSLSIRRQLVTALKRSRRLRDQVLSDSVRRITLSRTGEEVEIVDLISDETHCPVDALARRSELREVVDVVRDASPIERDAIRAIASGEPYQSVAARLGRSEKSIDNAATRVRRKIRDRLAA